MNQQQVLTPEESPREFSKRLNLPFEDFSLLSRALTHRSYLNENPDALEDNERLEFLGDAVLDFIVGRWLYNHFPDFNEGGLTRLRAALVRTEMLAEFAREIDLGAALLLGHGEDENGGRDRDAMLCAGFEAIVGALVLDAGIEAVQDFINPMLAPAAENIIAGHFDKDPKSLLQEWAQSNGLGTPRYEILDEVGPDHQKTFTINVIINKRIYGTGTGRSKQHAGKDAARNALEKIFN